MVNHEDEHKEEKMGQKPSAQQISRESHPAENETASDKWLSSRGEDEKSKPAVFTMSCPSKQHLTREQLCCVLVFVGEDLWVR